ncbi:hypothetical protein DFH01_06460 [Falsiroseomonas bella]|uniref:Uncharacterized protein n=1 Tax=Falsiroseomonas bella TaxID=2184016 RepID=A0A317FJE3_9PROT|nr:hypothetical protein [Falsiroseomonas bella]PWS38885.1 hypothetical protein DFH01_06460 [Falsiroseomonas bella]
MRRTAALLLVLLLAACQQPSRETVQLAGELRRSPPGTTLAIADRPFDCDVADRACVTLWLHRGAACATLAEAPTTPEAQRPARRDCAVQSFSRARALMPPDATADERMETAIRLADALERQRDRAIGEQRRTDNAAILAAVAPLRASPRGPGDGYADYYAAGVTLNRVQSGDIAAAGRCAALAEARDQAAGAAEAPGLPPLGNRIGQRRAAIAAQFAAQTPRCP